MSRRARAAKKPIVPDARYHNTTATLLIHKIMSQGRKATAEKIVYGALQSLEQQERKSPATILDEAVRNATPLLEVKARRVGGATYQVPVEVRPDRAMSLALRWLINSARERSGKSMVEKLAAELGDASKGQGSAIKKKDDTHKMAEANRAFAHYRW